VAVSFPATAPKTFIQGLREKGPVSTDSSEPKDDVNCAICKATMTEIGDFNSASPYAQGRCCAECNFQSAVSPRMESLLSDDNAGPQNEMEEEEPPGDFCFGAGDPAMAITYTMAGGGAHWSNFEVHYNKEGGQGEV